MHRTVALLTALTCSTAAYGACDATGPVEPIDAAKLIIENNAADGDIGIHGYLDHSGWRSLCVYAPDGGLVFLAEPGAALGDLGISSIFWESVEPEYEAWDFDALKAAFPEGDYEVRAIGLDGQAVSGRALFTTVVPEMPRMLAPPTAADDDTPAVPVLPYADLPVAWKPVTTSLDGRPVSLAGYQLIIVREDAEDPHGFSVPALSIHLRPEMTAFTVPRDFLTPGAIYEIEVIAIEASGNQTIGGASFFRIAPS